MQNLPRAESGLALPFPPRSFPPPAPPAAACAASPSSFDPETILGRLFLRSSLGMASRYVPIPLIEYLVGDRTRSVKSTPLRIFWYP